MTEKDSAGLPYCERDQIKVLSDEYRVAMMGGSPDTTEKCFNLVWGLVHGRSAKEQLRGVELVDAMLLAEDAEDRELLYLKAVGYYRLRRYLDARATLKNVLKMHPEFRQAESLLDAVNSAIAREGLIGVGAGAAILGVVGAIAIAALSKR